MKTARSRPSITLRVIALLAGVALVAAACGGTDDSDEAAVIVVETADNTAAADTDSSSTDADTSDDAGSSGNDEEQALEFAQCMRDEGIDFPDPIVNADGSVDFFGGAGGRGDGGGFQNDAGFQDAIDGCGSLIEGASFLPNQGDFTEQEDTFLEAAECLRDEGIDVADPDFGNGAGGGGPFGADFDPDDPATAAAIDACQDVFTALGLGQGGGN